MENLCRAVTAFGVARSCERLMPVSRKGGRRNAKQRISKERAQFERGRSGREGGGLGVFRSRARSRFLSRNFGFIAFVLIRPQVESPPLIVLHLT